MPESRRFSVPRVVVAMVALAAIAIASFLVWQMTSAPSASNFPAYHAVTTPAPGTSTTKLELTVLYGPICPDRDPATLTATDTSCLAPLSGATVRVTDASAGLWATLTSDGSGHASVNLPAGTYWVDGQSDPRFSGQAATVKVEAKSGQADLPLTLTYLRDRWSGSMPPLGSLAP